MASLIDAWGESWGTSWATSWTYSSGDTHDGFGGIRRRRPKPIIEVEPFDRTFEHPRDRLREQIRLALEGPQAPEVRLALEPVAQDSAQPLYARIDTESLKTEVLDIIQKAYSAYLQEIDEEEVFLLL